MLNLPQVPRDADVSDNSLIITTQNTTYVYDENIQLSNSFQPNEAFDTDFTSATLSNNFVFIGTEDFGLLRVQMSETESYLDIKPNGPLANSVFKIDATSGTMWATFGEYSSALNPYPLTSRGISYLINNEWKNIPFDSLLGTRELNKITPNIFNPNQVFISSFFNGILELNNFEPTIQFNQTNSGVRVSNFT